MPANWSKLTASQCDALVRLNDSLARRRDREVLAVQRKWYRVWHRRMHALLVRYGVCPPVTIAARSSKPLLGQMRATAPA